MSKILGIIPARSGSKGLINKNILPIEGKSLSDYTIEAALNSKLFDDIYYCTDNSKYQEKVSKYPIRTNPIRPNYLAVDDSSTHKLLEWALKEEADDTWVILLQVTSPLRISNHIVDAFALAKREDCAVVSVVKSELNPKLLCSLDSDGRINGLDSFNTVDYRRQNTTLYKPNGAIYIFKVGQFKNENTIFPKHTKAYIMDKESSIDIDDELDYKLVSKVIADRQ